jgi:uncharacterized membrane protein YwzB
MAFALLLFVIPIGIFAVTVWYFLASFLRRDQHIVMQILLVFAALVVGSLVSSFVSAAACFGIMAIGGFLR